MATKKTRKLKPHNKNFPKPSAPSNRERREQMMNAMRAFARDKSVDLQTTIDGLDDLIGAAQDVVDALEDPSTDPRDDV